jgi:glycosyltransferase involved in cell wall biosynthesis
MDGTPMRVCMFTECYLPTVNGVVVSVNTFVQQLQRLGVEVHIVAPRCRNYRDHGDGVCRLPSVTTPLRPDYPLMIPWWPLVASRLCARGPDLVHVHSPFIAGGLGRRVARKLGRPLVFTFHTIYEEYVHYTPLPRWFAAFLARRISRGFAQRCDAVVTPSEGIRQMLRRDGVTSRIEVIPTGLDPDMVAPERLTPIRDRWHIAPGAPLLAYIGRVAKEKSVDLMLEAFVLVRAHIPECVLLVVGEGNWDAPARALAAALGVSDSVRFAGCLARQEALRCAADADLVLFPSITDTQGLVVMEAMAAGTPCIAARSGAVAGLVRDGVNGAVVEHDPAAMAAAAIALLRDRERLSRMGAAAREAAQGLSAEAMGRRLLELYQSLLDQPAAGKPASKR